MSRGAWTLAVGFAVPIILCCGGGYALMTTAFDLTETKVRNFGNDVVKQVSSTANWDTAALRRHADPHFYSNYSEDDLRKSVIGEAPRILGTFVKGTSSIRPLTNGASGGSGATFEYIDDATFTKGRAQIVMDIAVASKDNYRVQSFKINPE